MPERIETISAMVDLLKSWSDQLPGEIRETLADEAVVIDTGERHGSWFLELIWQQGELSKSATLALTNPTPTADEAAGVAIVSASASATNGARFVDERLVENRRTLVRLPTDQLETWLLDAVKRALAFNVASLTRAYDTPVDRD
jgi:hypothetical protein